MNEVVIIAATRTPIGSFGGILASISAAKLGAIVIKEAVKKAKINKNIIDEVFMGNVLSANLGQAPARQAAIFATLSENTPCTTINKVCSSGLKAIMLGTQSIRCSDNEVVVAGGMESMSNAPYYLERTHKKLGNKILIDGLVKDGLTDVYTNKHMGNCAQSCASKMNFSRKQQDDYAIESYKRSAKAWADGRFKNEITPVKVFDKTINEDEEYSKVDFAKISKLKPIFAKSSTITAANASTINDGASATVLMSAKKADKLNLKPLVKILSYADSAHSPEFFTTAPHKAIIAALKKANLTIDDVDYFEINEAFAVVALANMKLLGIDKNKVNINGGAVSLGHPLGSSGSRIVVSLINILKQNNAKIGVVGICNGGGGASAMVIKNYE